MARSRPHTIAANDQIAAADQYRPIIIAYRNGSPVTIGDIAQIVDGLENDRTGGWYQGTPAVIIPRSSVNPVQMSSRSFARSARKFRRCSASMPAGVKLRPS